MLCAIVLTLRWALFLLCAIKRPFLTLKRCFQGRIGHFYIRWRQWIPSGGEKWTQKINEKRLTMMMKGKKQPILRSSVDRMRPHIINGLIFLTVVYIGFLIFLRDNVSRFVGLARMRIRELRMNDCSNHYLLQPIANPSPEYCPENNPSCTRPDLFGFQMSSLAALCYSGYLGIKTWYISRRVHTAIPQTPEGRVFGYLKESEELAAVNFTFQFWDLFMSFLIEEHFTTIMIVHHLISAFVSWSSLELQYLHYYGGERLFDCWVFRYFAHKSHHAFACSLLPGLDGVLQYLFGVYWFGKVLPNHTGYSLWSYCRNQWSMFCSVILPLSCGLLV